MPNILPVARSEAGAANARSAPASLSFLIYGAAVFALPQERDHSFPAERTILAAAISHIVCGAPFGAIYSGVWAHVPGNADAPLWQIFDDVAKGGIAPGSPAVTTDGNGLGYVLVATAALTLFGLHAWALPSFIVGLMGLSAAMLLWRSVAWAVPYTTAYPALEHVIIAVPARMELWTNYDQYYGHFLRYDKDKLRAAACGLDVIELKYFFVSLYPVMRSTFRRSQARPLETKPPSSAFAVGLHVLIGRAFAMEERISFTGALPGTSLIAVLSRRAG